MLAVSCSDRKVEDFLNEEEFSWLQEHKGSIVVAPENNFPPFAYIDEQGFFKGISADYLEVIENKLGIKFLIAPPFHLSRSLQLLKDGEIDLITSLSKTDERSSYLLFSDSYIKVPAVILTKDTIYDDLSLEDLKGWSIGLGKDYAIHEYLQKNYPYLNLKPEIDDLICLEKLAIGNIDAVITDIASASWFISENSLIHLSLAGQTDFKYELCMAAPKENAMLIDIIDKTLNNLSKSEIKVIDEKWIKEINPPNVFNKQIYILFPVLLLLVVLVIIRLYKS